MLVLYSANWSVRRLYWRIMAMLEWQRAQNSGICFLDGFPRNPCFGLIDSSPGRAGFPPWQVTQVSPASRWTLKGNSLAGGPSLPPSFAWHETQLLAGSSAARAG